MPIEKNVDFPVRTVRKVPKQERSKRLVNTILQAAARVLEESKSPFTTNHIAERAGVSIGSLYQYFPNSDAIMAALIEDHVAEELRVVGGIIMAKSKPNEDILYDLLIAYVQIHSKSPCLTARLHSQASAYGLQEYLEKARDAQASRIAQALGFSVSAMQMSVMAVEGVVLSTLFRQAEELESSVFLNRLYAIALAPLNIE
ncbi:MAG: TetR/AcrR family transcriptional regulator [Robiginitomaculum sp.]|nr:TetR/AcrR family transcriptional regulator [Robiginitomaculum sp.]